MATRTRKRRTRPPVPRPSTDQIRARLLNRTEGQPLLDIRPQVAKDNIRINGVEYPLRNTDQLTLQQYITLESDGPRLSVLTEAARDAGRGTRPPLSPEEDLEFSAILDRVTRCAIEAPEEVHAILRDIHRVQIAFAFIGRSRLDAPSAASANSNVATGVIG